MKIKNELLEIKKKIKKKIKQYQMAKYEEK